MADVLKFLQSYLDDPTVIMSKERVNEIIAEIERLRKCKEEHDE